MELNVGDYVRTKCGEICKLKKSKYNYLLYSTDIEIDRHNDRDCNDYGFDSDTIKDIINSSPNIIDLIEVGDYVNNYYVEDITNTGEELVLNIITGSNYFQSPFLYNEDIKSVLTHEQFETMKYKVGDN